MIKELFKKIIFRFFNKIFHTSIHLGNIDEVRLISNSGLKLEDRDIPVIQTILPYKITIGDLQSFLAFYDKSKKRSIIFERDSDRGSISEANQFFFNLFNLIESNIAEGFENFLLMNRQYFFSQEGEDIILSRFFETKSEGFYVDVGAHHPTRFSNTYLFYKLGWRGINIEPNQEVSELLNQLRPEDINLTMAVGNSQGEADFYTFKESAFNTFDESLSLEYQKLGLELAGIRKVETMKLADILNKHLISSKIIDFMSIDVENYELEVLKSNDWNKFRPFILLVEILNFNLNDPDEPPVHSFLNNHGYEICAKTYNTVFYRDISQSGDPVKKTQ
jgi:FkbM family methyltransferase